MNTTKTTVAPPKRLAFTDRAIQSLKPLPKREERWDKGLPGFGIRVHPTGRKTWIVRYRVGKTQRVVKLGVWPQTGLASARKQAKDILHAVSKGEDPSIEKALKKSAETFEDLATLYLEKHAIHKRSGDEDKRIIDRNLLPEFRTYRAVDVKRPHVITFIEGIRATSPVMSNRVLALLSKMYNFGIRRGIVEMNPCTMVEKAPEKARERVLTEGEIRGLWRGLEGSVARGGALRSGEIAKEDQIEDGEDLIPRSAVQFLLLTAQRRNEVLEMSWQEISSESGQEDQNLKGEKPTEPKVWWTIPGERAKNGKTHRVPLSAQALKVLEGLPKRNDFVFAGRKKDSSLTNIEKAIDRARARQKVEHFTPHDLRRTAGTGIAALGLPGAVAKVLNQQRTDVTGIYDRHSYDPEKRQALEAWGRRVEAIVIGEKQKGSVLPFVKSA